jgi:hypothetical protein
MQIESMRWSPLDEKEGNVGYWAIINEIFKRIGPNKNTKPSQYLKNESNSQKSCAWYEIKQYATLLSKSCVYCRWISWNCLSCKFLPSHSVHKEHQNCQHPKERNSTISIKLGKRIYDKYLSPAVSELASFPIDKKHFSGKLITFIDGSPSDSK